MMLIIKTTQTAVVINLFSCIQSARGPMAYAMFFLMIKPMPDITRMPNTHRFQATMNAMKSLKASLAH